jgi:cell wall-associated NlpC family hydrolase
MGLPVRAGLAAAAAVVTSGLLCVVAVPMAVVAVVADLPEVGCAGGGTGRRLAGTALDAERMGNAATIVTVAAGRGLPPRAGVIAIATAYQESTLRNLRYGDRDSIGLFQQRVSIYGAAVAADPVRSTHAFLARLVQVPRWQVLPITVAAQAVQVSAFPDAYARWQPLAAQVVGQLWPSAAAGARNPSATGRSVGGLCPGGPLARGRGGKGGTVAGSTTVPAGLVVAGSAAGQAAARFALAQLGRPYRWGAAGPGSFDCSGLVMAAWASAGVALPHWTGAQVRAGTPVPGDLSTAVAGDLVFIPGSDGTAAVPGHVGIAAGWVPTAAGRVLYLVQAPMTGMDVEVTDARAWAGQVVAVRHIR